MAWQTHPIALHPLMGRALHRMVWHVSGDDVALTLKVTGQRGIMAQDCDMSVTRVTGMVDQPLATPTVAWRARTLRLAIDGTARSGTLLLPTMIYSS